MRLVDFGFVLALVGSAAGADFVLALVVGEDVDALGLIDSAADWLFDFAFVAVGSVGDWDLALADIDWIFDLALTVAGSGSGFALDLVFTVSTAGLILDLEETRTVFSATDFVLLLAEADVLPRASLADASGIEFCGGWSLLAM